MEPDSSSVAVMVASMRRAVSAGAEEAEIIRLSVSSAICRSIEPVSVSEAEASLIASITSPMAPSNSAIAASMASRRVCAARSAACRCRVIAFATSKEMTCDTTLARSASLPGEKRCARASASSAPRRTVFPAELRIRASRPISASRSTVRRHDSA
jgi:hypothetical protein